MKIAYPLNYPIAVLVSGVFFVGGVRVKNISPWIMLPAAGAISIGGATFLKTQSQRQSDPDNQAKIKEIEAIKERSQLIAQKAEILRSESEKNLTESSQIQLLTAVQYGCNLALELPTKIERLANRLQGSDSLLSQDDLEKQLTEVLAKLSHSSGKARQQLQELAASLENNIKLVREGRDAREAQIASLSTLVSNSAGILQQLQNQLRTSNLNSSEQIEELLILSDELKNIQENVELLIT